MLAEVKTLDKKSHLLQMRGLKQIGMKKFWKNHRSHLLQMRGLKPPTDALAVIEPMSHLLQMRGLKPILRQEEEKRKRVASFTDAWIETSGKMGKRSFLQSHLLQMRGLKQVLEDDEETQVESHLLQMRGLKLCRTKM